LISGLIFSPLGLFLQKGRPHQLTASNRNTLTERLMRVLKRNRACFLRGVAEPGIRSGRCRRHNDSPALVFIFDLFFDLAIFSDTLVSSGEDMAVSP
jgi:hypothetical protein